MAGVAPEFTAYFDPMVAERRAAADPPDDFVTRLLHTEIDGQRLTDLEMRTQLAFLLMADNETIRHLIANMLEAVRADPALLARLRAERDLVPTMVEESLRHAPPIHVLMRDCPGGAEVSGTTIPAGAKVAFGLASANRDERMYDDPDAFKLDRPARETISPSVVAPTSAPARPWRGWRAASRSRYSSTGSTPRAPVRGINGSQSRCSGPTVPAPCR